MLFFGKENVFMCLAATKFVLWKINFGVWLIQTLLQKMLYMTNFPHTFSTVNMQIMKKQNMQIIPHSQKKQNPTKNSSKIRSNWDRAVKEKMRSRGRSEIGGEIGAIVRRAAQSTIAGSLFSLVGQSRPSSIADSLFFLSLSPIWALSSLSLSLSFSGNDLNWK